MRIETLAPGARLFAPGIHSALARKAGPFVFCMGATGVDPVTGRLARGLEDLPEDVRGALSSGDVHLDAVEGPVMAQTWVAYQNLRRWLEAAGSSLDRMLQAIVFLKDIRGNWAGFTRVRKMLVKDPPPSTALQMPFPAASDEALVQLDVIAGAPGPGMAIKTVTVPAGGELSGPMSYTAIAKKLGPLVFAMGTGGINLRTRGVVRSQRACPTRPEAS